MIEQRPPFEYRVTKYDPALRNAQGHYTRDEWTFFEQVARGKVSEEEYLATESAYIAAAEAMMRDAGVKTLSLTDVEANKYKKDTIPNTVQTDDLGPVMRPLLREKYWARLEAPQTFIHFGWDYYMYIGVPTASTETFDIIEASGLFVELWVSPYFPQEDDE